MKHEFHTGDVVMIEECRPLAKTKSWRVASCWKKHRPLKSAVVVTALRALQLAAGRFLWYFKRLLMQ